MLNIINPKTIMKNKIKKNILISLFNLSIKINLIFLVTSKVNDHYDIKKLYYSNEIKIKILGKGTQKILYCYFSDKPSEIYVNGIESFIDDECQVSDLQQEENIIIMNWNYKLSDSGELFSDLTNLIEVDFSNFDSSELTSMSWMFFGCTSLKSINFNNFNAPLLSDIGLLFYNCSSLISVDLASFDSESITNMASMFCGCSSLISVNFGGLNSNKV